MQTSAVILIADTARNPRECQGSMHKIELRIGQSIEGGIFGDEENAKDIVDKITRQ